MLIMHLAGLSSKHMCRVGTMAAFHLPSGTLSTSTKKCIKPQKNQFKSTEMLNTFSTKEHISHLLF